MSILAEVDDLQTQRNLRKFAVLAKKEIGEVVEDQARGFTRRILKMTPPMGGSVRGMQAKRALEGRILSDLHGIFAPVHLDGKGKEKHPDVEVLYRQQGWMRKKKRWGRRPRNPKYYVDRKKFNRLHKKLKKRVGRLGGGWNAAASALGVKAPAWFRRHGAGEGKARVSLKGSRPYVYLANDVPYQDEVHMSRVTEGAVRYQRKALARQIPYLLKKSLRTSRLVG